MLTLTLPGGYTVDLAHTSTGLPPDETSGRSLNASALWCRVTGPGVVTGWHETLARSREIARVWWDLVETAADIPDAWAGCVGSEWPPVAEIERTGVTK